MKKTLFHFKQSRAYFEGFFESCAPDVVPAGAFWELEIWLFQFFKPFVWLSCPQGPLGAGNWTFSIFQAPLSGCRARRGLLGAGNLTFSIFQALCPVVVPAGAFWELEIGRFWFFKPFVAVVVPTGAFWELELWRFLIFRALCSMRPARRGLLGAGNSTFSNLVYNLLYNTFQVICQDNFVAGCSSWMLV